MIQLILSGFDKLEAAYKKARLVIEKEENGKIPRFYIRCLVELEDFVNENWDHKSKLNKSNFKPLSALRNKIRKCNKEFEDEIAKFRENPDQDDEEEEEVKGLFYSTT